MIQEFVDLMTWVEKALKLYEYIQSEYFESEQHLLVELEIEQSLQVEQMLLVLKFQTVT